MLIMVASEEFADILYAFVFGYARFVVKKQGKKIYSLVPPPLYPLFLIVAIVVILVLYLLYKRRKIDEIELENYLTKLNEGILISNKESPGLLNGKKKDIPKLIEIAIDKQVIEHGETPNHIFFLLKRNDLDVFSDQVPEVIANKHVWLFIEKNANVKRNKKLERIGKVILFDPEHMRTCGNSMLVLGIIPRLLSLILKDSDTNLEHIYAALPDFTTISYTFPADVHNSIASMLKHQKHLCVNHNDSCLQITNCKDFMGDLFNSARFVKADTEPFFISFMEVA